MFERNDIFKLNCLYSNVTWGGAGRVVEICSMPSWGYILSCTFKCLYTGTFFLYFTFQWNCSVILVVGVIWNTNKKRGVTIPPPPQTHTMTRFFHLIYCEIKILKVSIDVILDWIITISLVLFGNILSKLKLGNRNYDKNNQLTYCFDLTSL